MTILRTVSMQELWTAVASVLVVQPMYAQERFDEPAPAAVSSETTSIFDIVIDLFGGDSSDSSETVEITDDAITAQPVEATTAEGAVQKVSPLAPENQVEKVEIQTTYAAAVRESQLHNRPVLAVLGAEWCVWCRKLEAELATPAAEPILKEWVVAKIDVEDEPEVATRLQASALPGLRILGPFQSLVASREGYVELAELKQWLAQNRASADPALHKVLYDMVAPDKAAVDQLVSMLSQSSPMVRGAAMERLAAHPRHSAAALVQILKTGRLVQQLCACEVLRRWSAPLGAIDPWQPKTLEGDEFAGVLEWSRQRIDALDAQNRVSNATSAEAAAGTPPLDSTALNELLQRLMAADPIERPGLIAQLVGTRAPLAAEVRSRLAQADAVNDVAREALRELLYNLLASGQLRLQQSGVIAALARLDSESHRQAAATILEKAAIIDQPLVDELAHDADPLVRELAVRALGRLSLLTNGDRIEQLLTDSSPNVRTAVLRSLSEHPSEQAVEALCAYLKKETDEDLLVHGAKCLGQLPRQPQAMDTLAQLAGNSSWRVRATAVEAAAQAIQANSQQPSQGWASSKTGIVPAALADAIVTAAFEEDTFVAERAATLLPTLLNEGVVNDTTLESIAKNFAAHPEKLESIAGRSPRAARSRVTAAGQQSYPALVNVAKKWLTRKDPGEIERAAVLLSRLAPTELNDRIGELIASEHRPMRLAGLRAAIDSVEKYRRTSIEAAVRAWSVRSDEANPRRQPAIRPWYELPAEEIKVSELNPAEKSVADASRPATIGPPPKASALDAAGDMFGDFPDAPTPVASASSSAGGRRDDASLRALPSKWMEHWQSGLSQDRPTWLAACESPTQALLASDDPEERAKALALWLMLGHTDRSDELWSAIGQLSDGNQGNAPHIDRLQLVSWLPADERLERCNELFAELGNDGGKAIETLEHCTEIDDASMAAWIFDSLDAAALSDPKLRRQLATVLLRSLIGFAAETLPVSLSSAGYRYDTEPPYRVLRAKTPLAIPGRIQACDWLRERYLASAGDRQRAIALMAVAQLDHKTAVDAALGAIVEADADRELLQVALSIALSDATAPSARRAMTLLSHPLPAVRDAALQLLASPGSAMRNDELPSIPMIDEDPGVLPGFWRAAEMAPIDVLRELMNLENDAVRQSRAILLLLAAGERVDLAQLERQIQDTHGEFAKLSIAAALAKAERTDEEAVDYYRETYAESSTRAGGGDDRIAAALYEALRNLRGDEIAELRRRMRNEKGSGIFNSNRATDDIFGSP